MQLPDTFLIRACKVRAVLGVTDDELQKLIVSGVLNPRRLHPGQRWRYFARQEVLAVMATKTFLSADTLLEQSTPPTCLTPP